jgi:hypothetical protein
MKEKKSRRLASVLGLALVFGHYATVIVAENPASAIDPSGMIWERHGDWHLNGSRPTLRLGEAVPPGALISAGNKDTTHSLTILLPDGQRMLCECFDSKTCAQGFRVPQITPLPTSSTWNMFVGVRNALLLRPAESEAVFPEPKGRAEMAASVEMIAPLGPGNEISIAPALRVLPAGEYSLAVKADGRPTPATSFPAAQALDWKSDSAAAQVRVGGAALYQIRVIDQTRVPRIEIAVLAVPQATYASEASGLKQTRDTIRRWSEAQPGWPLHSFLRVYLESRADAFLP